MQQKEGLGYDLVTRLRRREKESSPLQRLDPPDFYPQYRATVEAYNASIRQARDDGDEERLALLRNDLKRIQQRVREIYALREKKIAELAALKAGGGDPDVSALAGEEKPLFESFLLVMSDHRGAMLDFREPALPAHHAPRHAARHAESGGGSEGAGEAIPGARGSGDADAGAAGAERRAAGRADGDQAPDAGDAATPAQDEARHAAKPAPENVQPLEATPVQAPPDKVVLLAVRDLPPFSGVHRDYHVRKGDVFSVPRKRAEALVRMGAVVQVGS